MVRLNSEEVPQLAVGHAKTIIHGLTLLTSTIKSLCSQERSIYVYYSTIIKNIA